MVLSAAMLMLTLSACQPASSAPVQKPGQLVRLADQRQINLRCAGSGTPTVILESGFGADSGAWYKVQPELARMTRVCAYDRAGYGFSDPAPLPVDGATIARDLDEALRRADIPGPYVMVGHSAGGLYARLFAGRRLREVKGLVLLDPTVEGLAGDPSRDGLQGVRQRAQRCLAAAVSQPQPAPDSSAWEGCRPPKPDPHALAVMRRPETWRGQLSELDAIFGRTSESVLRMGDLLQHIPIYVLTASDTANAAPKLPYTEESIWTLQHIRLTARADAGWQRTVLSSHLMMIDRPDAVVSAVTAMVSAVRAGKAPEPLPPSEGAGDTDPFKIGSPTAEPPTPSGFESPGATK
ncbi:MAG TPA: alpha/beta hydrolase [Phenylobacterium sp.]|nr:alpha/beta hydrolase [Phenylobacterium sp.]